MAWGTFPLIGFWCQPKSPFLLGSVPTIVPGYAWSDPGPKPRTFAQINLELRDALAKLREKGPFVLVGHSYGGPVIRNFTMTYPQDVAGMVLVDSAHEGLRVGIGGKATMRLGDGARSVSIPRRTRT